MSYQIKINLRKGGLVVTKRGAGKTLSLLELLQEEDRYYLMVPNQGHRDYITRAWGNLFSFLPRRIIIPEANLYSLRGTPFNPHKHLLIDEFFLCAYKGPFFAATTTVDFAIRCIDNDSQLSPEDIIAGTLEGDFTKKELSNQIKGLEQLSVPY